MHTALNSRIRNLEAHVVVIMSVLSISCWYGMALIEVDSRRWRLGKPAAAFTNKGATTICKTPIILQKSPVLYTSMMLSGDNENARTDLMVIGVIMTMLKVMTMMTIRTTAMIVIIIVI